jgi:beta-galactosidase
MSSRSKWLTTAGVAICLLGAVSVHGQEKFTLPSSPRRALNFDANWKFFKEDKGNASGAEAVAFDDSKWETISTPHTYNDVDSFRGLIAHSGGDRGVWKGTAWYRKRFTLPDTAQKVFLEFEGMRQAGEIFLNGKSVGLSENGVTAYGVDISDTVKRGGQENVLAVHVDNSKDYKERATGTQFQWNVNDFNPNYGGLHSHVRMHITGSIYQTLPLFDGLKTTGVYIYPSNISVPDRTADVTAESQVHNASPERAQVVLTVMVLDKDGMVRAQFADKAIDLGAGEKAVLKATGPLKDVHWWSVDNPYLYDVYTVLTVAGKVVDVNKVTTGFRKTAFKGGVGTGGVFINDEFVYLKGFAQRSSNEWAGLGQAYPDWMHDFNSQLIRAGHGNYIRWMHVTPQKIDVDSCDRHGVVQIAPAGDKERVVKGRQWQQRLEVMIASMVYLRNSPSILFWEAGNTGIPADQLQQMVDLRKKWDPNGGRIMGCRTLSDPATTPIAEYYGVMIGQDPKTDALKSPTALFRAYSAERRDRAPLIETEDFRDEAGRRFWDDYSPPYFGFKKGPKDAHNLNSETFALGGVARYWAYYSNRISNTDPAHSKWSGYASIYFSDSNADGRQESSEVARVSGKVDAVRIPKPIYFAEKVMQNPRPDIYIIGHWTYPKETRKTVYVIANTPAVELLLNGKSLGKVATPKSGYIFAFKDIQWEPGTLTALGFNGAKETCRYELTTAGAPQRIKLTPIVGPKGLQADGGDVALIDVEVVDAQGRRCPTDDARIDFTVTGPAIWRGGYNSGRLKSTNNLFLNTECGINRVALRSTFTAGKITVTATREGLEKGAVEIEAKR